MLDAYAFGAWRGTPVEVWETWNNFPDWATMERIPSVHDYFTGEGPSPFNRRFTGVLSFSQPLWAKGESAATCAGGAADAHYANVARALVAAGYPDAYVRLGWEMNGTWFWWHATDANAAQWIACWQRAYAAFKAVSPAFRLSWNPTKGSNVGFDARKVWPGDQYVDVVGVDFYGSYPPYHTQADWDVDYWVTQNGAPKGMGAWLAFARAHGKPISFPEWGLDSDPDPDNPLSKSGDDAIFIENMHRVFNDPANLVAYESYFNLLGCGFSVFPESCHPRSAATYATLF